MKANGYIHKYCSNCTCKSINIQFKFEKYIALLLKARLAFDLK